MVDNKNFPLKEDTYEIIGCAMEVINVLGHGLLEKPYENALVVELRLKEINFEQQPRYNVKYKNHDVGIYIPDLVVSNQIIVDTKVIEDIGDYEVAQMMNYLRITKLGVGLIINFKHPSLKWKRIVI